MEEYKMVSPGTASVLLNLSRITKTHGENGNTKLTPFFTTASIVLTRRSYLY